MLKRIKQFFQKSFNDTGSVLSVSLILLVVVTSTAAAITSVTINQSQATKVKLNYVNEEVTAKRLIQRAITDYENFMTDVNASNTFDDFDTTLLSTLESTYQITITNVTDQTGFEDFGLTADGESRVYRFAYTLDRGLDLVMYSYISTTGSSVEQFEPFGFSVGTNGDLILTGGEYTHANMFASNMYVNFRGPYINQATLSADITPDTSNSYPDYQANGADNQMFVKNDYMYCTGNCFSTSGIYTDFTINKGTYTDIETYTGTPDIGLETGDYDQDIVISDFFGNFSFEDTLVEYIQDDAPTGTQTFSTSMNLSTIGSVVASNSSIPTETCVTKGKKTTCVYDDSGDLFTNITSDTYFDPENNEETLYFSGYHSGNLIIENSLDFNDKDNDTLIIDGNLTINNTGNQDITIEGKFVVLGDLTFNGGSVDMNGLFYVTGQVLFNFDIGEGLTSTAQGNDAHGMTLLAHDHVIFESFFEDHTNGQNSNSMDAFIYTDESIYIDAVNNRINIYGSLFANAKGESGNNIPIEDSSGPINGIVITSYQGYINNSGNAVPSSSSSRQGFKLTVLNSTPQNDGFFEIPIFESFVTVEGSVGTPERSEFSYE